MRILVAGGFGFVGGRLAQYLQQAGHQVILGSRVAGSPPSWLPGCEVVRTNWDDAQALAQICNGADVVVQAAGMNAQNCTQDPAAALEFNGLATARLYQAAIRAGVGRFVYLSTAHVYASPLTGLISEDTCPRNLHPYATSHLAAEHAVLAGGIEGIVLRMSNVFGAPAHKDVNCWMLLVNDLSRQAVQTGKMSLNSSGLQQRDFIPMAEVCRIIGHLSSCVIVANSPRLFNVGSGMSKSVHEMARLIQQRCGFALGFVPDLLRPAPSAEEAVEILEYRTDSLAKMALDVNPDYTAEIDGLLQFCRASFCQSQSASL